MNDAPVISWLSQQAAHDLIVAAINEAHSCKESQPERAARLLVYARQLERALFAVQPFPYQPAPAAPAVVPRAVRQFVATYTGVDI